MYGIWYARNGVISGLVRLYAVSVSRIYICMCKIKPKEQPFCVIGNTHQDRELNDITITAKFKTKEVSGGGDLSVQFPDRRETFGDFLRAAKQLTPPLAFLE